MNFSKSKNINKENLRWNAQNEKVVKMQIQTPQCTLEDEREIKLPADASTTLKKSMYNKQLENGQFIIITFLKKQKINRITVSIIIATVEKY